MLTLTTTEKNKLNNIIPGISVNGVTSLPVGSSLSVSTNHHGIEGPKSEEKKSLTIDEYTSITTAGWKTIKILGDGTCGLHCMAIALMENIHNGHLLLEDKTEFLRQFGQNILSIPEGRAATVEQVKKWVEEHYFTRYHQNTYRLLSEKVLRNLLGGRIHEQWSINLVPKIMAELQPIYQHSGDEKNFTEILRASNLNEGKFGEALIQLIQSNLSQPQDQKQQLIRDWLNNNSARDLYITEMINKGWVNKNMDLPLLGHYFGMNMTIVSTNGQEDAINIIPDRQASAYFLYTGIHFNYKTRSTEPAQESKPAKKSEITQTRRIGSESTESMNPTDIHEFYNMLSIKNLAFTLENGILSRSRRDKLENEGKKTVNIAANEIQDRRKKKFISYTNKKGRTNEYSLHRFANLYLNPHNAMMATVRGNHKDICVLQISREILNRGDVILTSQNAATDESKFSQSTDWALSPRSAGFITRSRTRLKNEANAIEQHKEYWRIAKLSKKDRPTFNEEIKKLSKSRSEFFYGEYPEQIKEGSNRAEKAKQVRQAEALLRSKIKPRFITGIIVPDEKSKQVVEKIVKESKFKDLPITVYSPLFYVTAEIKEFNPNASQKKNEAWWEGEDDYGYPSDLSDTDDENNTSTTSSSSSDSPPTRKRNSGSLGVDDIESISTDSTGTSDKNKRKKIEATSIDDSSKRLSEKKQISEAASSTSSIYSNESGPINTSSCSNTQSLAPILASNSFLTSSSNTTLVLPKREKDISKEQGHTLASFGHSGS